MGLWRARDVFQSPNAIQSIQFIELLHYARLSAEYFDTVISDLWVSSISKSYKVMCGTFWECEQEGGVKDHRQQMHGREGPQ